jgi:hypothetical protein
MKHMKQTYPVIRQEAWDTCCGINRNILDLLPLLLLGLMALSIPASPTASQ